jgi:hypothetical protein
MWSRGYRVSDEEVGDIYDVLARHGGMRFLHDGAGFVDEHRRNAAASPGSLVEVREDGVDAAVGVAGWRQVELCQDVADVLLH